MKSLYSFEEREIKRKCWLFGNLFKRSKFLGYGSKSFIEQIMTLDLYDDLYNIDWGYDWCDECWLLRQFELIKPFRKGKKFLDDFELWFMGYLYKYWTSTRNVTRQEIYKILPFDKFHRGFAFYHTQDWDFVIDDVKKYSNSF